MKPHDSNHSDVHDCGAGLCFVVPPQIFDYMAKNAALQEDRDLALRALAQRAIMHAERELNGLRSRTMMDAGMFALLPPPAVAVVHRKVYTARTTIRVPGTLARNEGQPASADVAVNEAYDGSGTTWQFYETLFGRNSVDGHGLPLVSTVHYDHQYNNAFWNGNQMIYGDGDAKVFDRFTKCLDVIGHELTHGVTQYTANLAYHNQSGALNESISDVFGSMIKQKALGQTAATADWLIGAGLFIPKAGVNRTALRSMKAPGTAYNDPATIGQDPQPADMSHYVTLPDTPQGDFGGVHINSGIPNRAFYEAAIGFGGNSWDKAGKVWFAVLTGGTLGSTANFADFRNATVAAANTQFGASGAQVVTRAWATVGL
jgi:Zn-dependent metalloprotease